MSGAGITIHPRHEVPELREVGVLDVLHVPLLSPAPLPAAGVFAWLFFRRAADVAVTRAEAVSSPAFRVECELVQCEPEDAESMGDCGRAGRRQSNRENVRRGLDRSGNGPRSRAGEGMSLAGYRASNHPQQISRRGALDAVDDRATDPEFFRRTAERFGGFTLERPGAVISPKGDRPPFGCCLLIWQGGTV